MNGDASSVCLPLDRNEMKLPSRLTTRGRDGEGGEQASKQAIPWAEKKRRGEQSYERYETERKGSELKTSDSRKRWSRSHDIGYAAKRTRVVGKRRGVLFGREVGSLVGRS